MEEIPNKCTENTAKGKAFPTVQHVFKSGGKIRIVEMAGKRLLSLPGGSENNSLKKVH